MTNKPTASTDQRPSRVVDGGYLLPTARAGRTGRRRECAAAVRADAVERSGARTCAQNVHSNEQIQRVDCRVRRQSPCRSTSQWQRKFEHRQFPDFASGCRSRQASLSRSAASTFPARRRRCVCIQYRRLRADENRSRCCPCRRTTPRSASPSRTSVSVLPALACSSATGSPSSSLKSIA